MYEWKKLKKILELKLVEVIEQKLIMNDMIVYYILTSESIIFICTEQCRDVFYVNNVLITFKKIDLKLLF